MPLKERSGNLTWFTPGEAAQFCGCSVQNIHDWIDRGVIAEEDVERLGTGKKRAFVLIHDAALRAAIVQVSRHPRRTGKRRETGKTS